MRGNLKKEPQMASRKKPQKNNPAAAELVPTLEQSFNRIANLLALLLVKGESESEKILTLTSVGYSPAEIGRVLNKQANTVSVALYHAKKERRR
jgi:DNA-binding CsgD family transcriptional regulator